MIKLTSVCVVILKIIKFFLLFFRNFISMNTTEFDSKYDDSSEEDSKRKSKTNVDEAHTSSLETRSYQPSTNTPVNKSNKHHK